MAHRFGNCGLLIPALRFAVPLIVSHCNIGGGFGNVRAVRTRHRNGVSAAVAISGARCFQVNRKVPRQLGVGIASFVVRN